MLSELQRFLQEDLGRGDLTTEALIPEGTEVRAVVLAKERGILAGIRECRELLSSLGIEVVRSMRDGDLVEGGSIVLELMGDARKILGVERTLLNLLGHMSGIATLTNAIVRRARSINPKVRIAATRKTLPGLRYFEKRAVEIGGGDPHRYDLSDMVLIKDNHLRIVGSVDEAVRIARERVSFTKKVEVEVSSAEDAVVAARAGADVVMLDNLTPSEVMRAVEMLIREGLRDRVILEVSGGITADNVDEYAALGIDVISMGALTHSASSLDLSLEVVEVLRAPKSIS